MRRLLISAAVLALLAAPVMAQPDKHDHANKADAAPQGQDRGQQGGGHDRGGDRGGNRGAAPAAAPAAAPQQQAPQQQGGGRFDRGGQRGQQAAPPAQVQAAPVAPPAPAPQDRGNRDRQDRGNWQDRGGQNNGRDFNRSDNRGGNNFGNRDNRPDNRSGNNFGNNRGNSGFGGQRHDFSSFRDFHRSFNAPRRFHAPDYRRPNGWYGHRWSFGEFLPSLFWAPNYWLNDYYRYGLPQPPYGTVWVRDGYDALLIDRDSGEIITVEYDVFY